MHRSHPANVLEPEIAYLRAPTEEEGVQGEHGGDVADADVSDVDAPERS